jgi:hypothetical protein
MSTRHGTSWSASLKRTSRQEEDLWAQSAGSTGLLRARQVQAKEVAAIVGHCFIRTLVDL